MSVDRGAYVCQSQSMNIFMAVPDYNKLLNCHMWAWKNGEQLDQESGIHHLAHAMCCLMFLYEHDTIYSLEDNEKVKNETIK